MSDTIDSVKVRRHVLRLSTPVETPPDTVLISLLLSKEEVSALDRWIEGRPRPHPSRSEALHRLIRCGLTGHPGQ